jgi:hypothetical protein
VGLLLRPRQRGGAVQYVVDRGDWDVHGFRNGVRGVAVHFDVLGGLWWVNGVCPIHAVRPLRNRQKKIQVPRTV